MKLEKKIIVNSFIPDIIAAVLIFAYATISTQVPIAMIADSLIYIAILILGSQFLIAPGIDHLMYRGISRQVDDFKKGKYDEQERTELLEKVLRLPFICAVYTSVYFIIGSFAMFTLYQLKFVNKGTLPQMLNILSLLECLYGSYFAALYGYSYCNKICSEVAYEIVNAGVTKEYVLKKKNFGMPLAKQLTIFIMLPLALGIGINIAVAVIGYQINASWDKPVLRMISTSVLNYGVQFTLMYMFFRRITISNKKMRHTMEKLSTSDITTAQFINTDIGDEISYNHYLTNEMLSLFRNIIKKAEEIGETIKNSSQNLIKASNETEATAVEQSTGTSEIVSTMEQARNMTLEIESHITEVSDLANKTVDEVSAGSESLHENLNKMHSIEAASKETINGIMELNERISSIWEIVTIINTIADQTKIIAFNAELESTGVQEAGKNFRNVANEIRRLANSTMDSTHEIKERINEIQNTADTLIKSSQSSTEQILNGTKIAETLEDRFSNIRESADANASSAMEIKKLVKQQSAAFEQIVKTLHQISNGIQSFSVSTRTIIDTSSLLNTSAGELESVSSMAEKKN